MLTKWQSAWRQGVAPLLSEEQLELLAKALLDDDPRLIQCASTSPPALQCVQDWPIDGACALGFCGWQSNEMKTVAEVEEHFARMCFEIDQHMGEPAVCRHFLRWYDDTPRPQMRRELLREVQLSLEERREEVTEEELYF